MNTLVIVVKRNPIVAFLVLAYGLGWIIPLIDLLNPAFGIPLFPLIVNIAAIIITAFISGWSGVKSLLAPLFKWRIQLRWYAVALFLPIVLTLGAAYINMFLFGAVSTVPSEGLVTLLPRAWYSFFLFLPIIFLVEGSVAEAGWRGYLLPLLKNKHSDLTASVILGIIYTSWHLPLILLGKTTWWMIPMQIFATVIWTWLYNSTNRSLFMTALFHSSWNTIAGIYVTAMFIGADAYRFAWLTALVWGVGMAAVVYFTKGKLSSREVKVINVNSGSRLNGINLG